MVPQAFTLVAKTFESTDGTPIYCEAVGDPSKPALVFTHGLTCSSMFYDVLFTNERLLDKCYLIRYDLRGHGRSGKPDTLEAHASGLYADDFLGVLRQFGIQKCILFGFSFGVTVLTDLCTRHLDDLPVLGCIAVAALPYVGPIMRVVGLPTIMSMLPGITCESDVALFLHTKAQFIDSMIAAPEALPYALRNAWFGQLCAVPPRVAQRLVSRPQDPQGLFEAGRRGFPLLSITGTHDLHVNGQALVEELQPYFKNLDTHVIEGGAHTVYYDHPDEVVDVSLRWLDKILVSPQAVGVAAIDAGPTARS
ncbi:hypothetical protein CERSUDRAFT_137532 [Gelatoporia subvermispora B]|uniref:AB hydrolase-1 domain-containing protein n=1 Tax=Ceriporiopsis subvermispora (strain B) TaxID=914234 RepID=M2QJ63_CERS8|nr:hypothetical protein CERSUDRAFT_137532 [Gelatoporia subvermispora B]